VALLLAAAMACAPRPAAAPPPPVAPAPGLPDGVDLAVERVVDGDTIVVTGRRPVRLIGVDAPETVDPRRAVGCFGREASDFLKALLPEGTPVRLVGDVEQEDRFGRTLAYVYRVSDGLFVNAELLRQGYAEVLTIPPNVAHADEFVALARGARNAAQGLWSACPEPD
jgi:micrococcal nuclease